MDTILQAPQWPASLASFVTWCLMWDPRSRPTSSQALGHEYFSDAFDPLRPKSSASRLLGRKQSDLSGHTLKDSADSTPSLTTKTSSWFRRSLVARESAPAVPQHTSTRPVSPRPSPVPAAPVENAASSKARPNVSKRATWTNGVSSNAAPIPILPSIRPVSPLSDAVTARASVRPADGEEKVAKKIGRQLSVASHGNHYADVHRQEAERALNGQSGLASPPNGQKESFFSHLRKRARRLSGRYAAPMSPNSDDIEANAGCAPWSTTSNRGSMAVDPSAPNPPSHPDYAELDKALQNTSSRISGNPGIKRHHSLPHGQEHRSSENTPGGPISSRTRRAVQKQSNPSNRYETPNEEEELLDEVLTSTAKANRRLEQKPDGPISRPPMGQSSSDLGAQASYMTPSPSANRDGVNFGQAQYTTPSKPMNISKPHPPTEQVDSKWPTPPYDENDWAASATASIFATQTMYR